MGQHTTVMMKPANLVLDLLRTYGRKGTCVRGLMDTARMFKITDNAMRVTLSRLVGRGLIEKVSRGHYRLAEGSDPINDFVEEWRLGERRRRNWQEHRFLIAHSGTLREKDTWVLHATGFREFRAGLWLRPDNLIRQGDTLQAWLRNLGLSDGCLMAEKAELGSDDEQRLVASYDIEALNRQYLALTRSLETSADRLSSLPGAAAMKESFTLGGRALQVLAKDPCLPTEIQNPAGRRRLWQIMLDYDELGRRVWADTPDTLPADMTGYA